MGLSTFLKTNAKEHKSMAARGNEESNNQDSAESASSNRFQQMLDATKDSGAAVSRGTLYRKDIALADLKPGECGYVLRLNANFCSRLRLLEMGLTPGTHVKMIRGAAFGGPIDIEVRGYQLSLRRDEAAAVWLGEE
jgi:ferrous iron transport protein A